ncbi:hypothetical protein [Noviherbaspirillum pedocola]|uniref:Pilus assembly protein n=1 Tax=Noviherbaspirillum pedocola TaxID=2801341 RepID=A0A934T1I0_9BURK|nr:hypothetical protein [Noviherbaspirillum pedocola]MBK4735818.1 hypothetical protein [Noviherbaspirillum pedocola]
MSRLGFDFGAGRAAPPRLGIALLAAGILAAGAAAMQAGTDYAGWRDAAERQEQALIRMQTPTHARIPAPTPEQQRSLRAAALLTESLRAPWGHLLGVMETGSSGEVALLSVEPLPAGHELRVTGEARNYGAMLDYLAYLQRQPELNRVVLTAHQLQRQAPGAPLRFALQAHWGQP